MSQEPEIAPPWISFPRIPWGSVGWRMGFGEVHWNNWLSSFRAAPVEARARYKASWPEPKGWQGFYEFIETGAPPRWVVEREHRIAAAAVPPADNEHEIRDPYRISWMLRSYLTRPKVRVRILNYGLGHSVFRDPAGNAWCLAEPRSEHSTDVYLYRYEGELVGEDNLPVERPLP